MERAFISSTFVDLKEHRAAVRERIQQMGLVDVAMESFGARDERPKRECVRLVREESDYFVGIYAHRYGFVPAREKVSVTESEYNEATLANLPRLIYLVDEDHPWPPRFVDSGTGANRLRRLRRRLLNAHVCERFNTPDHLASLVAADLGRQLNRRHAVRVGPGIDLPDIGIDSIRGKVADGAGWWNAVRYGVYETNRDVFLTHVIEPSRTRGQKFDVYIYLLKHHSNDLSDVRLAEFFLGEYWESRVFPAVRQPNGFIGIATAAYGTFLCICKVTFNDGYEVMLQRYIDFESSQSRG